MCTSESGSPLDLDGDDVFFDRSVEHDVDAIETPYFGTGVWQPSDTSVLDTTKKILLLATRATSVACAPRSAGV